MGEMKVQINFAFPSFVAMK